MRFGIFWSPEFYPEKGLFAPGKSHLLLVVPFVTSRMEHRSP